MRAVPIIPMHTSPYPTHLTWLNICTIITSIYQHVRVKCDLRVFVAAAVHTEEQQSSPKITLVMYTSRRRSTKTQLNRNTPLSLSQTLHRTTTRYIMAPTGEYDWIISARQAYTSVSALCKLIYIRISSSSSSSVGSSAKTIGSIDNIAPRDIKLDARLRAVF